MITTEQFTITSSCSSCRNCTMGCFSYTYFIHNNIIVVTPSGCSFQPNTVNISNTCTDPEKEKEIIEEHIDRETINFWNKLKKQKLKFKYTAFYKPSIKRRSLISKSGWLPKSVRKRKKGH